MRFHPMLLLLAVGSVAFGLVSPAAAETNGEVSVLLGIVESADDRLDEAGAGSSTLYGLRAALDFGWPVSMTAALLSGSSDGSRNIQGEFPQTIDTDSDALELDLGVRRDFRRDRPLRPYVAAGLAWIRLSVEQVQRGSFGPGTEYEDVVLDDDDAGLGYWLSAGLTYRFAKIHAGLDVRWSDGSAELHPVGSDASIDLDAGGFGAAVFVGYHW